MADNTKTTASASTPAPKAAPKKTTRKPVAPKPTSAQSDAGAKVDDSTNAAANAKAGDGASNANANATATAKASAPWLVIFLSMLGTLILVALGAGGMMYAQKSGIFNPCGNSCVQQPAAVIPAPAAVIQTPAAPIVHATAVPVLPAVGQVTLSAEVRRDGTLILTGSPEGGSRRERLVTVPVTLAPGADSEQIEMTLAVAQILQKYLDRGMSLCFEWQRQGGVDGTCQVLRPEHVRELKEGNAVPRFYF